MTDHRYHLPPPQPGHSTPLPPTQVSPPGHPSSPAVQWWQAGTPPPVGTQPPRRGAPRWVVLLAVATAVLSVTSFTTVLLWPTGEPDDPPPAEPLSFHPFESAGRIDFDQASRTTFVSIQDDRMYLAWEQGGDLIVVAADVADGAERWRQRVSGSPRWGELFPIPGAVIAVGADDDGANRMYVLDAGGGAEFWRRDVSPDDWVSATAENLLWYDEPGDVLRGMDITTGGERWSHPVPGSSETYWTLTRTDQARPTDTNGFIQGVTATDPRVVVADEDRSVRVLDASDGTVTGRADNVASPADQVLSYDGRLYVASDERGYQVLSYDLDDLPGLPQTHYRGGADSYVEVLRACGTRVCVLETQNLARDSTEVVAIDVTSDEGEVWRQPAPGADDLLGVGSWVVATGSDQSATGFGSAGEQVLDRPGVVARLNDGNLLVFADSLSGSEQDVSVAGIAVEGERPVELGQLRDVVGEACSWNEIYLACPDQDGVTIWRFAEP